MIAHQRDTAAEPEAIRRRAAEVRDTARARAALRQQRLGAAISASEQVLDELRDLLDDGLGALSDDPASDPPSDAAERDGLARALSRALDVQAALRRIEQGIGRELRARERQADALGAEADRAESRARLEAARAALAQPDGSLAAYAETSPSLGGIDIFGGAGNGGISIGAGGTVGADGTFELSGSAGSTRVRAIANGKPGGADIDGGVLGSEPALPAFELLAGKTIANQLLPGSGNGCPTVAGRPDICRIALQPGVSLTLDFGFIWGSITFVDVQDGSERIDPAGQFSEYKFGGLTAELGVGIPGVLGLPRTVLGSVNGGILGVEVGVQVPEGGLYAAPVEDSITVDKTVDPAGGQIAQGGTATYTVAATNQTGADRADVTVSDDLSDVLDDATLQPGATATYSDGSSAGPVTVSGTTLSWTGDIPLGETVTLTYAVKADKTTGNGTLGNDVVAAHPDLLDGTDGTDTVVVDDALAVQKSFSVAGDNVLEPGDTIDYTVVVTNGTGARRTGVTITDDLSAVIDDAVFNDDATAVSSLGGSTGTLSYTSPNLRWTGDLAVGESVTLTYSATVRDQIADGVVTNSVVASHPDLVDGTDSVQVDVVPVLPLWMAGGAALVAALVLLRRRRFAPA